MRAERVKFFGLDYQGNLLNALIGIITDPWQLLIILCARSAQHFELGIRQVILGPLCDILVQL